MEDLDKMKIALQMVQQIEEILETIKEKEDREYLFIGNDFSSCALKHMVSYYEIQEMIIE